MLAIVLSLALFAYLGVVGYAVLSLLSDEEPFYLLLLAPAVGATSIMLPTFLLNEIGIPVKYVAHGVLVVSLLLAFVVLWRRGRRVPLADLWPYAVLICIGLLLTGWPMLRFGFDWVSFCNDDMANYCMGAERVLHYGYYQPPDARALAGQDYTQFLWFLHLMHRPGSEMVLALVAAVTRLSPLLIFMPVILAFMLCQISAAGAMAFAAIRSRTAAWLTMVLVGLSALVALGTLYQLIAQVIGLAVFAALVAVFMRPIDELLSGARVRRGILIGLLTAGVIFAYSEMVPFLVVGYALYTLVTIRSWKGHGRVGLKVLGIALAVVVLVLNRFLGFAVVYVLGQAGRVPPEDPVTTLFPYYMMPAGTAYFWGLFPLGKQFPDELWLSTLIGTGIVISIVAGLVVLWSAWRKHGPAVIAVVMGLVFLVLFEKRSGFGMYKLAMYFQPFILAALAIGWVSFWKRPIVQIIPLVALAIGGLDAHRFYVRTSLGQGRGAFSEIPGASATHLVREYESLLAAHPGRPLELDTYNLVLAKFQMLESRGRPATFPSNDFLHNLVGMHVPAALTGRRTAQRARSIFDQYIALFPWREFDMHPDRPDTPAGDPFPLDQLGTVPPTASLPELFVAVTGRQAPFNRWHDPEELGANFRVGGRDAFGNHLIFVASQLGEPYYVFGRQQVSVYQLETDLQFPERTMSGVGRYLLFQAVNPSSKVRLELALTATLAGDRLNRLPPAAVIGQARVELPMLGRGSARVVSEPLNLQLIDGRPFLAVDMGTFGTFFNYEPRGLMRLYGRDVRLDHRQMVGFLRDVSLISDEDYQLRQPPAAIQTFPQDLMQKSVEYSGIYEDGWVGDHSYVVLSQPPGAAKLVVRGEIPDITGNGRDWVSTEVTISVDGVEVARKKFKFGEMELAADLPRGNSHRRIALSFSDIQNLPDPDGRPVGAKLERIAIEPATPATAATSAH